MSNKVFLGYSWVLLASIWSTFVNIVVDSEFLFGYSLMGILGYSWVFYRFSRSFLGNIGHLVNFGQHCGGGDV